MHRMNLLKAWALLLILLNFGVCFQLVKPVLSLEPDFSISASPTTIIHRRRTGINTNSSLITVTSKNGFNQAVYLNVEGPFIPPSGVTVFSPTPNPVTPPPGDSGTSTLTFSVLSDATPGTFKYTVTGYVGVYPNYLIVHSVDVYLQIDATGPNQPHNVLPAAGAVGVDVAPTFRASDFSDPHGELHSGTNWQITTVSGDYTPPALHFDSVGSEYLTQLNLGDFPSGWWLSYSTIYYWRVRYLDTEWSDWSTETWFTTISGPSPQCRLSVYSAHDSPVPSNGDSFWSDGQSVTCSVTSPVTEGGTVWICTGWSGTGSVPSSGTGKSTGPFTITQDSSITWEWQSSTVLRTLTVSSLHDSPNPNNGPHSYSDGQSVTCSVTSPVVEGGVSYTCTGWSGTGSVPASGTGKTVTFTITQDSSITWNWQESPPPTYDVVIRAHCNTEGLDVSVPITKDGSTTGFNTPHTFTGLSGSRTFTVPSSDGGSHPFLQWSTFHPSTTITVSSGGFYTAFYQAAPPPPNQPPNPPNLLSQQRTDGSAISVGVIIGDRTVVFKGSVSDPDSDSVRLEVELRRLDEYGGQFDETKGGLKPGTLVPSGGISTATADGLIDAQYHWRARTIDEHGLPSAWVDFGLNDLSMADFEVRQVASPRIASIDPSSPVQCGERQCLSVLGEGFVPDSIVNFSIDSSPYEIPRERTLFINPNEIMVVAGLTDAGSWKVWIINPGNLQSDKYVFEVRSYSIQERAREVAALALQHWSVEDAIKMTAIALCESDGCTNIPGDLGYRAEPPGDPNFNCLGYASWGLWQIFMGYHEGILTDLGAPGIPNEPYKTAKWLCDPTNNTRAARGVWDAQGFSAWSVWKPNGQGPYLEYMEISAEAVNAVRSMASRSDMLITKKSPVDLVVTDPQGFTITKDVGQVPGMFYLEYRGDSNDSLEGMVYVWDRKIGDYLIAAIPQPDAAPTDTYSLEVTAGDTTIILAQDVSIEDTPSQPYIVTSNEATIIPHLDPRDVGITRFITSKTVVGQTLLLPVNVTIFNYGQFTETLNVTVYVDTTIISTLTDVTLPSRNSTTVALTWDTSGFAYGNHTIRACVEPVPGETNLEDNNFTKYAIVTIPGDTNGDFTVDIYDAIFLSGAYNSNPADPDWKANADINNDNNVDIYDAIMLANNYGKTA